MKTITIQSSKSFANGCVYLLKTPDNFPIEVTDTFLPFYTKDAVSGHANALKSNDMGSRNERWMVAVTYLE